MLRQLRDHDRPTLKGHWSNEQEDVLTGGGSGIVSSETSSAGAFDLTLVDLTITGGDIGITNESGSLALTRTRVTETAGDFQRLRRLHDDRALPRQRQRRRRHPGRLPRLDHGSRLGRTGQHRERRRRRAFQSHDLRLRDRAQRERWCLGQAPDRDLELPDRWQYGYGGGTARNRDRGGRHRCRGARDAPAGPLGREG